MVAGLAFMFIGMFAGQAMSPILEPALRPLGQQTEKIFRNQLLPAANALTLFRRKEIDATYFHDQMQQAGFSDGTSQMIFKSLEFFPQIQDAIRFAVRESFRDDIATLFQTDKNFELLPVEFFEKIGISRENLRLYWRAHWELPSVGQGFEMFQRLSNLQLPHKRDDIARLGLAENEIQTNQYELELLLTSLDVMPAWQKRLMMIAYQPITRVDIRRFVEKGIMNLDDAAYRFRELGNSPSDAELQVKFIRAEIALDEITPALKNAEMSEEEAKEKLGGVLNDSEATARIIANIMLAAKKTRLKREKDLTLAQILNAYSELEYSEEKTLVAIQALGYDHDEAQTILALKKKQIADAEKKALEKEKKISKSDVIAAYMNDTLTRADAAAKLDELTYDDDDIEMILLNAETKKDAKKKREEKAAQREQERAIKEQSKADTLAALKKGVISEAKAVEELREAKFSDEAIAIILATAVAKMAESEEDQS